MQATEGTVYVDEPKFKTNPWRVDVNQHYGFELFYGEVGIARLSPKGYQELIEYCNQIVDMQDYHKLKLEHPDKEV